MLAARRQPSVRDISLSQHGMWFFDRLTGASPLYTIAWRADVVGPLDRKVLAEAVGLVVYHHEALRSRFEMVDGKPSQIILRSVNVPLPFDDLTGLGQAAADAEVDRLVDTESRTGLDIRNGPLLKVRLIQTAPQRHVLLLCVHHIVFDIVSTDVFFRDLATFYNLLAAGEDPDGVAPATQYAEFTAWQAQSLRGDRLDEQVKFWTTQLDGAPHLLDLPTDHPRPAVQTFRGAAHRFIVGADTTQAMRDLAAAHRCTPFMVFMAAYQLLLSRFSGQSDICVATPMANRAPGLENLIGLCLNMVVVRSNVTPLASFADLLHRVRETCLDVYEHAELPFDRLVEALAPDRALSHNPLVQVTCGLNRPAGDSTRLGEAVIKNVTGLHLGAAKFDLSFGAVLHDNHIAVTADYSADLFDRGTIAGMARAFTTLLDQVCHAPDTPLTDLPPLGLAPHRAAPPTQEPERGTDPVTEFLARATQSPDAVALALPSNRDVTFADLATASAGLAARLSRNGASPETTVTVADTASLETVAAALAVLRCGAGLAVASPDKAAERITAMRSRLLVADADTANTARQHVRTPLTVLVHSTDETEPPGNAPTPHPVRGEFLAAVVRTAGTGGTARDVALSRTALAEAVTRLRRRLALSPADRVLVSEPLESVRGIVQLLAAVTSGATACLPGDNDLQECAATARITVADLTPRRLRLLDGIRPGLRALTGMERDRTSSASTPRGYGTAETASYVAFTGTGTGYHPADHCTVYILDDRLCPVPPGSYGHIHVSGATLARGYLNAAAATAATWLPDPFTDRPGARMVRTGDIGRVRPDGALEFLVREPHLTNPRIDPALVEQLLATHPAIDDAVVLTGGHGVVAHIVLAPGRTEPLPLREVQAHLGERLARYMLPTAVLEHRVLPLLADGRVDQATLRAAEVELAGSLEPAGHIEPRTDLEQVVVALLRDLLDTQGIGVGDNIFDLGGHSILIVKLLAQISEVFDADLSLRTVFEAPTAAELAVEIESAIGADNAHQAAADAVAVLGLSSEELQRKLDSAEDNS
nr:MULTISPECIES: condensation domain-containing protein [unclassified Streptomyces]